MDTQVITLDPSKGKDFSIKRINKHACSHISIEVDIEAREVRCRNCNTIVDPFEFIAQMAMITENHFSYMLGLQKQNVELETKKHKLEQSINYLSRKESKLNGKK